MVKTCGQIMWLVMAPSNMVQQYGQQKIRVLYFVKPHGKTKCQVRRKNHMVTASVSDPYHFDTDPDPNPGCEKICYRSGSGSRVNFDTDPDPGKNDSDPDPAKKD